MLPSGRLSNSQKDEIEGQVAELVKASKDSLQGLQKYVNTPGAVTGPGSSQPVASKDAIAHRQGVVRTSCYLNCKHHLACLHFGFTPSLLKVCFVYLRLSTLQALILSLKLRAATDTFNLAREQRHQQQLHQDQQQKRKRGRFTPSAQVYAAKLLTGLAMVFSPQQLRFDADKPCSCKHE